MSPSLLPTTTDKHQESRRNDLHQIAASIQNQQNMEQTLQHILVYMQQLFNVEGSSIALHSPEDKEFYFIRAVEDSKEEHTTSRAKS